MLDPSLPSLGASKTLTGLPGFDAPGFARWLDDDGGAGPTLDDVALHPVAGLLPKTRATLPREVPLALVDPLSEHIHKIAMGDQRAFCELHRACAKRVLAFALRIVKRHELAEEIASNVFMQVWRDACQFDPGRGCVIAWINVMARSRSLDVLRQLATRQRHEEPLDDSDLADAADPAAGPCDLLQSMRVGKALRSGLARLSPAQQYILRLTFFEGLSHEEVAATASLPLGTVKSHARRGLAALRTHSAIASMGL